MLLFYDLCPTMTEICIKSPKTADATNRVCTRSMTHRFNINTDGISRIKFIVPFPSQTIPSQNYPSLYCNLWGVEWLNRSIGQRESLHLLTVLISNYASEDDCVSVEFAGVFINLVIAIPIAFVRGGMLILYVSLEQSCIPYPNTLASASPATDKEWYR